ncbi:ATP/GTP-binding protein [Streptomyces sp. NPDC006368]|uniref:ATP/GTP-binding protein n=1 Tax=Streptomyces sp. NPDC006368 TaxID=3156760 RepID=UPI0033A118F8
MDTDGTYDARGTHAVPPPARPPRPPHPPRPRHAPAPAPATGGGTAQWLRTPRPAAEPGVWRFGHRPRPAEEPAAVPGRQLLSGALIAFLCGWLIWSLLWNRYLEGWWIFIDKWWLLPLRLMVPESWTNPADPDHSLFVAASYLYYGLLLVLIAIGMGRLGNWNDLWHRYGVPLWPLFVLLPGVWREMPTSVPWLAVASSVHYVLLVAAVVAVVARVGAWPRLARALADAAGPGRDEPGIPRALAPAARWVGARPGVAALLRALFSGPAARRRRAAAGQDRPQPRHDPADWPELRDAGLTEAADRLTEATRTGTLGDVDYARIHRAWQGVRTHPERLAAFTDAVRAHGPAACAHPSGARDLPGRTAAHDLVTGQVRIGTAADHPRNPYPRRTTGVALEPDVLGTSLLAVGPAGSGKTATVIRPVIESLCLQALANRAAVVAVTAHGAALAPDEAFDLVVRAGRADSTHDLDLYGGADDPDEAARVLAEALVGDLVPDSRRAATALAQLIGPYRAAYGRFPAVPELRELLGGAPEALAGLRAAVAGDPAQLRELDARARQSQRGDDIGELLAERIAFLDRPAFARFFRTDGEGRQFSLRAIEHPLRVRVDLPERGHAEASRIVARLLLAQFTEAALARGDRSLFACLVLDDASHTVTADSVRAVQRLRSAHAGVVLALRTLEDVPEALRGPLLGAVGCRMAFAGLAPWDGGRFAETWGTEWVQTRDVTNRQIISDEPLTKALHFMRRLVTGKAATAEAVTVREVERQRWSASDLAHAVPAGHAVLSLTGVRGEHTPPLLVDLRT